MSEKEIKKGGFTHDNKQNKTQVWVTPAWIFETLSLSFDLDPATEPGGIDWIPAQNTFSEADNGLKKNWHGKVWLNPPYGPDTPKWLKKMHDHRNGIALVFARTDTKWFFDYCINADAICFLKGRIAFVDWYNRTKSQGAGAGSMLIAWGEDNVKALENFKDLGFIVNLKRKSFIEELGEFLI